MSYVYRGTGTDTLTGELDDDAILRDITAHEGEGWTPPLRANQAIEVHGTYSAARRCTGNNGKACEDCTQAVARRWQDRDETRREADARRQQEHNRVRRERYAAARAAGLSRTEAKRVRERKNAA